MRASILKIFYTVLPRVYLISLKLIKSTEIGFAKYKTSLFIAVNVS